MMPEPSKTFQNLSHQKRDRITRVIIEEFASKGFDGASINAIVGRLNIAKGSIFQYFGDKKGIFMFVFDHSVGMVKNYLKTVRDQSYDENLPTRLQKTLFAGVGFIKRHPLLYRLYLNVLFDARIPFRDEILLSLRTYSLEFLESLLETAKNRGELQEELDIKKTAFMLDAVMDRFLQARAVSHLDAGLGIFDSPSSKTEEWIRSLVSAICSGIHVQPTISCQPPVPKTDHRKKPYLLILSATQEEVSVLIKQLQRPNVATIAHRKVVTGKINEIDIRVLVTGPGMVNTSQALTAAIENERPCLVIQTGCCGAYRESGLKIGDIAIASEEIDAQLGIESADGDGMPDPLPFALLNVQSVDDAHRYPVSAEWVDDFYQKISCHLKSSDIIIKKGPFVTVSTVTSTDERARALVERFTPVVEQMEGSAAAHISLLYGIPFFEIRGVSNMAGRRMREAWDLQGACWNCCETLVSYIKGIELIKLR
jgi:futalosine hydrolase